jgi:putative PIN family toxin of toxin-antitoxin system
MATVVIDTNVLISALVGHGKPRQLVTELVEKHVIVSSRGLLVELLDVLSRERFNDVEKSHVDLLLSILARKAVLVPDNHRYKIIVDDPDDDLVLNAAHLGKADYVVSGDRHLLNLKVFKGIKIVSVKTMLELL